MNEELQNLEWGIPIDRFDKDWKNWNMELEMNVLNRICQTYVHFNGLHMPVTQEFKKKNRYLEVLPYSHTLVGVPNSEGD